MTALSVSSVVLTIFVTITGFQNGHDIMHKTYSGCNCAPQVRFLKTACANRLNQLDFVIQPNLFSHIRDAPKMMLIRHWNWIHAIYVNGHGAAVFTIVLHRHGPILTSSAFCLFVSIGLVPYTIFVAAEEIWGNFYHETAAVSFSPWVRRWWW